MFETGVYEFYPFTRNNSINRGKSAYHIQNRCPAYALKSYGVASRCQVSGRHIGRAETRIPAWRENLSKIPPEAGKPRQQSLPLIIEMLRVEFIAFILLPEWIKGKMIDFFIKTCKFWFIEVSVISARNRNELTL